jgi:hypothetical protein
LPPPRVFVFSRLSESPPTQPRKIDVCLSDNGAAGFQPPNCISAHPPDNLTTLPQKAYRTHQRKSVESVKKFTVWTTPRVCHQSAKGPAGDLITRQSFAQKPNRRFLVPGSSHETRQSAAEVSISGHWIVQKDFQDLGCE